MIFDNREKILKLNKRRYTLVLAYVTLMAVVFFSGFFEEKQTINLAIIISVVYIIYNIIAFYINYSYFSYRDDNEYLNFRFVSMRPLDNRKKAIKIHKDDFAGYKFEKSWFGYREILILKIKSKNGIANYPPISVSALSEKLKSMLKNSLNQYV